ncbi:nucleoporin 88-like [Xenia sp. Carnegie-2017]|uniref:nucleoporin 88-like n=1 Tax=Xenia sp. Carnegie-2017 TaxID=2897299 RepID=UPI001F033EB3|nr:nucleoporin 88-like [Xenia sp. Carnegie-2017]
MAAKNSLSFRNSQNYSPTNVEKSPLAWESLLPSHAIFKAIKKKAKLGLDEPLDKNILCETHGDLFLWDDEQKLIYVANLKNLKAKNEQSSKYQTLLCTSPPLFKVEKIVFSETGAYLALIGQHGICVIEMPQKRGKFTQFEHGKEQINCRSINIDEHFFVCHQSITIFEAKWFPGSYMDIHLIVLTSDNQLRIYDVTKPLNPLDIISVGAVPQDRSFSCPGKSTFAEAFGEIAVSFDFSGALSADSFTKIRAGVNDVAYSVFLLRENGDVLFMMLMLLSNRFFYDFQGCLPVFPPAEDNYGVDSCTIICFPTNPIVVAIATCGGLIYHCVVLESEEDDVFSKPFDEIEGVRSFDGDSVYSQPSTKTSLYVYECIDLSLSTSSEREKSFVDLKASSTDTLESRNDSYSVQLFKDYSTGNRYHCFHPTGIHTITLPWLRNLQRFCNETEQAVSFDPNENGIVQHVICTNPVPSSSINLIGFTVVSDWELGGTIVALTDAMECITKSLRYLNRDLLRRSSMEESDDKTRSEVSTDEINAKSEFDNHIKLILKRDASNPLLRSSLNDRKLPPKDCFQFLTSATQTYRTEYINRQTLALEEVERRIDILDKQYEKQTEDLNILNVEKRKLQERMEILAEKYEDTKDRQELIVNRIENILENIQLRQPVLSNAETRMKQELEEITRHTKVFQQSFDQLRRKQKYLGQREKSTQTFRTQTLSENHKKQLSLLLKQESDNIQALVKQVNNLKLQVGF